MASPTPNKGYTYPAHGSAVNAWDTPLNTNFDYIDLNVGGLYDIVIKSTATTVTYGSSRTTLSATANQITLPASLAQNLYYRVFGDPLERNLQIEFPSAGGFYIIDNDTTGDFTVTPQTATGGSVGPVIDQGTVGEVVSDGTDMHLVGTSVQAKLYTYTGDPNGNVEGNAGASDGSLTDFIWDTDNRQLYACTTGGTAATAVWSPQLARLIPQGILTVRNNATTPVLAADTLGTSTIYYRPYTGEWTLLSDGSFLYPYKFSAMTLTLRTGNHLANNIYDVFIYANPTAGVISPVIGTGPSWLGGTGGSITAGACERGTGGNSTELTRMDGVLVNTNSMTIRNDTNTYTVPIQQGVYLGSILIDATAGQVTCYRFPAQDAVAVFGVWNAFNRLPISLSVSDPDASWTYSTATYRFSNNNSLNKVRAFCGLPEEMMTASFIQHIEGSASGSGFISIGENDTTVGQTFGSLRFNNTAGTLGGMAIASAMRGPKLGIWEFNCLERAGTTITFSGNKEMRLTVNYRG